VHRWPNLFRAIGDDFIAGQQWLIPIEGRINEGASVIIVDPGNVTDEQKERIVEQMLRAKRARHGKRLQLAMLMAALSQGDR
jgi:hypothetical protein